MHDILSHILEVLFYKYHLVYFEYLQHKNNHSIYMWLWKQLSIYNINLFMHTYRLLSYLNCSGILYQLIVSMIGEFLVYLPNTFV